MKTDIETGEIRAKRLATCPARYREILKRSWAARSRKTAIKAFCLECVGFERGLITTCTAVACPLWGFRPYVGKNEGV